MLTRSGVGALVAAVLLCGCGWWWHYEELIGLAVGIGGLVLMAVWVVAATVPGLDQAATHEPAGRTRRPDPARLPGRNDKASGRAGRRSSTVRRGDASISVAVEPLGKLDAVDLPAGSRRGAGASSTSDHGRSSASIRSAWRSGNACGDSTATVIVHPRVYDLLGPHGCDEHRRERVGGPQDGHRSAVGVRVASASTSRRRPATHPLAHDRSHRHADGEGARRAPPSRVHRRARHRRRSDRRTTSRKRSMSPRRSPSTRSAAASMWSCGPPIVVTPADRLRSSPTPPCLDLLTPVQQSEPTDLLPIAHAVQRRVRPDLGRVRDRTDGPVELVRHVGADVGRAHRRGCHQRHRRRARQRPTPGSSFSDGGRGDDRRAPPDRHTGERHGVGRGQPDAGSDPDPAPRLHAPRSSGAGRLRPVRVGAGRRAGTSRRRRGPGRSRPPGTTRPWRRWRRSPLTVVGSILAADGGTADLGDAFTSGAQGLLSTEWPSPARPELIGAVVAVIATAMAVSASWPPGDDSTSSRCCR